MSCVTFPKAPGPRSMPAITEAAILERIIELRPGLLTPDVARYVLSLTLRPEDRQYQEFLLAKEREGALTTVEEVELRSFRRVGGLLAEWQSRARQILEVAPGAPLEKVEPVEPAFAIPAGIRRSEESFWRDLPQLLSQRRLHGKWVCYHGDERIGTADDDEPLIRECIRRGISAAAYYLDVIEPHPLPPWELLDIEGGGNVVDAGETDDLPGAAAETA